MTWRSVLAALIRGRLINLLIETEAQDIVTNGFSPADDAEINAFLDSTYTP